MIDCAKPITLLRPSEIANRSTTTIEVVMIVGDLGIVVVDAC